MKKLLLMGLSALWILACSIDPNYLDCLYQYMTSKEFRINGAFYKYDFNRDGVTQRNDWIYFDLGSEKLYRLLGKEPTAQDRFGWLPLQNIPSDFDANNITGLFVYLGFWGDPQTAFSWVYIPVSDEFTVYKLNGATPNGSFVYMDLDCDGSPDPLPGLELAYIKTPASSNIELPGMDNNGQNGYRIAFKYNGALFCDSSSKSSSSSSSSQSSSSSFSSSRSSLSSSSSSLSSSSSSLSSSSSSSSSSQRCFAKNYFVNLYTVKDVPNDRKIEPALFIDNGVAIQDGYIVGGSITQNFNNPNNRGLDGYIARLNDVGEVVWARIIYNEEKYIYPMNEGMKIFQGKDAFYGLTPYSPTGFSSYVHSVIVSFDRDGHIRWNKEFYMPDAEHRVGVDRWLEAFFRINALVPMRGGGFLAVGETNVLFHDSEGRPIYPHTAFAMRVDGNAKVLWAKTYNGSRFYFRYAPDTESWAFLDGVEGDDGYIYLTGFNTHTIGDGGQSILVVKLDGQGRVLWSKNYNRYDDRLLYNHITTKGRGIAMVDGALYVAFSDANYVTPNAIGIMKLTKSGELLRAKILSGGNNAGDVVMKQMGEHLYVLAVPMATFKLDKNLVVEQTFVGGYGLTPTLDGGAMLYRFQLLGLWTEISRFGPNGQICKKEVLPQSDGGTEVQMKVFATTEPAVSARIVRAREMRAEGARRVKVEHQCLQEMGRECD